MEPFTLPCADELFCKEYQFSPFQQSLVDQTIRYLTNVLNEIRVNGEQFDDMYYMRMLIMYIVRFYVSKFTTNDSNICTIYTLLIDEETHISEMIHKVTDDAGALIEILCNHIPKNLSQCGVFTECWDNIDPLLLLTSGTMHGIIIPTPAGDGSFEYERILESSFEQDRKRVLEEKFAPKDEINHNFEVTGIIKNNTDISECGICCNESTFVCANCKYAMCNECIDKFKHSTGQCPCCQVSPMKLLEIVHNPF